MAVHNRGNRIKALQTMGLRGKYAPIVICCMASRFHDRILLSREFPGAEEAPFPGADRRPIPDDQAIWRICVPQKYVTRPREPGSGQQTLAGQRCNA
jgi:hypothetical protein